MWANEISFEMICWLNIILTISWFLQHWNNSRIQTGPQIFLPKSVIGIDTIHFCHVIHHLKTWIRIEMRRLKSEVKSNICSILISYFVIKSSPFQFHSLHVWKPGYKKSNYYQSPVHVDDTFTMVLYWSSRELNVVDHLRIQGRNSYFSNNLETETLCWTRACTSRKRKKTQWTVFVP